jgi:hypothetical protein
MVKLSKNFSALGFGLALAALAGCDSGGDVGPNGNVDMTTLPPPPTTVALTGTVVGVNDQPLAGATIALGSQMLTAGADGTFTLNQANITGPVTLRIANPGYAPLVTVLGPGQSLSRYRLQRLNIQSGLNPNRLFQLSDPNSGAAVSIPAKALTLADGSAVVGNVSGAVRYIDPGREPLPGSSGAVNSTSQKVYIETLGALYVEVRDSTGNLLVLKPGTQMTIDIPISKDRTAMAPSTIALWHLDPQVGGWQPDSASGSGPQNQLTQQDQLLNSCTGKSVDPCDQVYCDSSSSLAFDGQAQSLGYLAAAIEFNKPSCVRLSVQSNVCLQFEIPFNGGTRLSSYCYSPGANTLFDLSPNANIKVRTQTGSSCPPVLSTGLTVNSGAAWGGPSGPPPNGSQCSGSLSIPPLP